MDEIQVYEKTVSSLNKNSSTTVSYSYKIPANVSSSIVFKVTIDPDKTASITIPVIASSHNLILESLKTTSSNPKPGQNITWVVKVKNAGNVKVEQIKIALFADKDSQVPTSTLIIPSLNSGISTSKNISWTVPLNLNPALNYPIRAVVDPDNTLPESNETDNGQNYSLSLTVPDLSIEKGEYFNATGILYPNTFQQVNIKAKNNNITAVSAAKVGVYYSLNSLTGPRTKLVENTVTLSKNATVAHMFGEVSQPANLPLGTQIYYFLTIDGDNNIPESNETNNEITMQRTITERPPQAQGPYIFVTVRDEDSNSKNGVIVTLTDVNQPSNVKTKTTGGDILTQNRAGTVIFDNLPNTGKYTINISTSGYRAQTNTFDYDRYDDQTVYRDFDLDKKAALIGTVKNSSGTPLKDVRVVIDGINLETLTDSQGKYGFMLNGGTYNLRFVKKGYARIIENNLNIAALSTITLDKTMATATTAYVSGMVTDDEGNGMSNVDIYTNGNMIGITANDGHFTYNSMSPGSKTFKFKKPGYVDTEFTQVIEAGEEYDLAFTMYKPSTDTHVERGTEIVSWHQHEGTPGTFWTTEYNVDVWWGMARTKMALDFTKTSDNAKLTKLVINNHGKQWECNQVEGSGDIETSAIDIPITISAGSCTNKLTQMDVYKVSIESDGQEVWYDDSFWTSASDSVNTGTKVFNFNNLSVNWNSNFKVKMWVRVQKRAVIGTDGDGAGALYGYHLDKKLITWHPQKPPTTVISTSWGQFGNYLLGILDNPVTAVTDFTDLFTVESYNTYTMSEVLPADFPGFPPEN